MRALLWCMLPRCVASSNATHTFPSQAVGLMPYAIVLHMFASIWCALWRTIALLHCEAFGLTHTTCALHRMYSNSEVLASDSTVVALS